jgi:ribosomal protein L31E
MAKEKTPEPKIVLEREYIVPLRSGWLKVPKHKRAAKAVKTLKEFIARHMKVYDRDLRRIKIDIILNNEIRFRGMKKPPAKIKVMAKKLDNETVRVELVNIPAHVSFARLREQKKNTEVAKKVEDKKKVEEEKVETEKKTEELKEEDKEEAKEKEKASRDEGLKESKQQAKEQKHVIQDKRAPIQRKTLSR